MKELRATFSVTTPQGRGAVATICIDGPDGSTIVGRNFLPAGAVSPPEADVGRILFGRWRDDRGEEIVVCRVETDRIEIHCHGGDAASNAICQTLIDEGCTRLDNEAWLRRTTVDPIERAARRQLVNASTLRTAEILLAQMQGALRRALIEIQQNIQAEKFAFAENNCRDLLARADVGLHLVKPWRVVLAGDANVGKSSLINAIVGFARAIVFDTPGTTRDVLTAATAIDGWPFEFSDTAGLRATNEPLESAGIELAKRQIEKADLVVLVFDGSRSWKGSHPWDEDDQQRMNNYPDALIVFNKCDLNQKNSLPSGLLTSATTGEGLNELLRAIVNRLVPNPPAAGVPLPFTIEQTGALAEIQQALARRDTGLGLAVLATLMSGNG